MKPVTALLLLSSSVLSGAFYLERERGLFAPRLAPARVEAAVAATAQTVAQGAASAAARSPGHYGALGAMVERPLFHPSRRPPAKPEVVVAKKPTGPDVNALLRYALVGAVITREDRVALLRAPGEAQLIELRQGDRLLGWTVLALETDSIAFAAQGLEVELRIDGTSGG